MSGSRTKIMVSVAILVVGLALTALAVSSPPPADSGSSGIIIDFGDYETVFTDTEGSLTPYEAVAFACDANGFTLSSDGSNVISIDGIGNTPDATWSLFVVKMGSTGWDKIADGVSSCVSDYSAVCYGYCGEDEVPAPAVDKTGVPIHGYLVPDRLISIAPSCTETVCFGGGIDLIVGTDRYSDYPTEVVELRENGVIAEIGGFTNPSYEMVIKERPDLVVCISSQNSHIQLAEKLRSAGIDVLVLDGGESVDSVLDNIYQVGVVLDNQESVTKGIHDLENKMMEIGDTVFSQQNVWERETMVALSAVKSPWVSGNDTYVSDVMSMISVSNIYSAESGWVQVNSETISKYNPEVIIIVSSDYDATQSDYDMMLESMSSEWRSTDAFRNGEIYLFTGDAADCASRAGPRVAQLTELLARAVHGEAFDDDIVFPHFIGDDYVEYLSIARSGAE